MPTERRLNRRRLGIGAILSYLTGESPADVVEPESDIRPALPFSEAQARALMRPTVSPTIEVHHE